MKNVLIFTARKEETAKKIYDELKSHRIADSLTKKPLVGGRCICTPYISILCTNDMHLIASKNIRFDRIFVLEPSHCSDNLLSFLQNKTYQSIIIMPSFNQMIEEICNMSKDEWLVDEYCNHDIKVTDKLYTNLRIGAIESAISIKNVIFNHPATIVFWTDGTKTVVKAQDGDIFDPEKGLAMAISKKAFGNKGNYCNELKKWLPKKETLGSCTMSELEDRLRKLGRLASKIPFFIPKLDSKEEYNPVQKAYDILLGLRDGKVPVSKEMPEIDEIIGYLGEALDD